MSPWASRADRMMIGTVVQPRRPRDDLDAVHVGQAEVEDDQVGRVAAAAVSAVGAVADGFDLVLRARAG